MRGESPPSAKFVKLEGLEIWTNIEDSSDWRVEKTTGDGDNELSE